MNYIPRMKVTQPGNKIIYVMSDLGFEIYKLKTENINQAIGIIPFSNINRKSNDGFVRQLLYSVLR